MKPSLDILVIAYNQAAYIGDCLAGIVNQRVEFPVRAFIADDCSFDGTSEIIMQYRSEYPDRILPFISDQNVGIRGPALPYAWQIARDHSNAKYLALVEGDDYWTDPLKLQKQVDYLEAHPDVVLCGHRVKILERDGRLVDDYIAEPIWAQIATDKADLRDLLTIGNFLHTPSVVFRNIPIEFPPEFMLSPVGDYFLYVMLAEHGLIKILDDVMAVYRSGVGLWSQQEMPRIKRQELAYQACLISYLRNRDHKMVLLSKLLENIRNYESTTLDYYMSEEFLINHQDFRKWFAVLIGKIEKYLCEHLRKTKG